MIKRATIPGHNLLLLKAKTIEMLLLLIQKIPKTLKPFAFVDSDRFNGIYLSNSAHRTSVKVRVSNTKDRSYVTEFYFRSQWKRSLEGFPDWDQIAGWLNETYIEEQLR